jgi:hypothetical protein
MNSRRIKQYIVLRPSISPAVATIGVAHGVLACYLRYRDDQVVKDWISGTYGPFYKVICQARDMTEFNAIMKWKDNVVITESKLDNLPVAIVFKPIEYTKSSIFNELKLYDS